jgi:hypothetical protein
VDNDGDALVAGALFFDTVNTVMKVYDGSQWLAAYASVSGALLAINNLDDVTNTATARSNLGLGTASEQNVTYFATAAQGALADSALQNGDNVSVLTNDAGYATTTYVDNEVAGLVDSAPATLDTLNELAAALGDDANFSTTVTNSIATKWTQDNTKISNWNTAYGWGNHASAGYLTGNQTITLTGDVSGSGTTSISVTVANDSHTHDGRYYTESEADSRFLRANGGTTGSFIDLFRNVTTGVGGYIDFREGAAQDIRLGVNVFDGEIPEAGTALILDRVGSGNGDAHLVVHGNIYANHGGTPSSANRVYTTAYHPEADKWTTARTLSLTGAVTGSVSVDGSGNVSLATTATSDPTLTLTGDVTGSATFTNLGNATLTATVANDSHTHDGRYYTESEADARFLRGNTSDTMSGTFEATGDIQAVGGYTNLSSYTSGTVPITVGMVDIRSGGKTGWAPGDELGKVRWYANDTSGNWPGEVASIRAVCQNGNGSTTTVGSAALEFYTTPSNSITQAMALRLDTNQKADFQNDIRMNGTTVIDSSRNLTNIGGISADSAYFGTGVTIRESTTRSDLLEIVSNTTGWGGLSITNSSNEGVWSLMVNGANAGLYDEQNAHWHVYASENAGTSLWHNGTARLETTSSGVSVTGAVQVGGATFIDSTRRNLYLDSFAGGDNNGIFFRTGFTSGALGYNCSITVKDHNGAAADGLHISGYDGVGIGTGANTYSLDLLVDVSGNTNVYGHLNSVNGYQVNGTTVIDASRNATFNSIDIEPTGTIEFKDDNGTVRGTINARSSAPHFRIATSNGETIGFYDGTTENIRINGSGDLNLITGSLEVSGTTVIDSSRNLTNIGTISSDGAFKSDSEFTFLTGASGAQTAQMGGLGIGSSYSTYPAYAGEVNVQTGYRVGGTRVIDSSRNLTNIANITANDTSVLELTVRSSNENCLNFDGGSAGDHRGIAFNSRTALSADVSDGWLRLNSQSEFTNGVFTPGNMRVDGHLDVSQFIRHVSDTNTYITFPAADDMQLVAGGRQMIRMDEGTNPDRLYFPNGSSYTDSNGDAVFAGNVTAYASDRRLKTRIKPIENALAKVMAIRGVTYDWIEGVEDLGFVPGRKNDCMGVIAQELEEAGVDQVIMPAPFDRMRSKETNWEDVSRSGEEYKTVDYDKLTALLIEAVKEQQTQINALQAKIEELENGNN